MLGRQKILIKIALLICFVAIINLLASKFFWYQSIWWFDMPMHFLGGLVVLFLLAYLLYSYLTKDQTPKTIVYLLLGVMIVGIGWEIFEYIFNNLIGGQTFILFDTISDICFDIVGALVGIFLLKNKI